jgi:hypothetical protein
VKPYDFRYLFYPEQFDAITLRPEYSALENYLFPEKKKRERGDEKGPSD